MTRARRRAWVSGVLFAALVATSAAADEPALGHGELRLVGATFDVEPVAQSVPVGIPAVLRTVCGSDPPALSLSGLRVSAELSGPGLASPVTLTALPGDDLTLPSLPLKGEYRLEAIRLSDGAGTSIPAAHPVATVTVTDVLVSTVSSRVLTPADLADRGILVDGRNLRGLSYSLGLAISGRTISVELPPLVWNGRGYEAVGPPRVRVDRPDERFQPPTIVAVPLLPDEEPLPPFEESEEELPEETVAAPAPVFGLLVFPGDVRFLNQFLCVVLMVQNGSAPGSGLTLRDVSTRVQLPAGALRLAGSTPSVADGAPIPVRHPGPDGALGTEDDLVVLAAQQAGTAEAVAEGLTVGTHEVVCEIEATLDGLAGQPPRKLSGRARGSVVVRDPSFALTFHHPEIVREGEEYELRVTVANTSTVAAHGVELSIDAASLTGAVPLDAPPGGDPRAELGDILPSDAADARFRLRATRTGRVVASAFASDDGVSGSLRLRTAVTNDGSPLSPDSFVFPAFVSALPAPFVDAATRLLGIAHGLATADPSVAGGPPPPGFSDGAVRERAIELVQAARRARLGQPPASAVADVLLRWLGVRGELPGFDRVRRGHHRGRELEAAAGTIFDAHLRTEGADALAQLFLDAAVANAGPAESGEPVAGPAFVLLAATDAAAPPAQLRLLDAGRREEASGGALEAGALRDLPHAALVRLEAPGGGQAALVGRLPASGLEVVVEGTAAGAVALELLYPDGGGGFSRVRFPEIPVQPGSRARTTLVAGATGLALIATGGDPRFASARDAAPSPFAALSAVQDLDANPLGKVVTLLFNRPVAPSAVELRRWRLPSVRQDGTPLEREVDGAAASSDPRLVSLLCATVVDPARPGSAKGDGVPAAAGGTWTGELPVVVRLAVEGGEVEGRVLGPDGTPLAGVPVRLSEAATSDLTGRTFHATTATTKTDSRGAFAFGFVRRQDGRPFRVDAYDPATGSRGWAAGSIRQAGSVVHVDVALLGRGTVRGVLVDGSGARVARAIVRCGSDVEPYRSSVFTSADGSFVFASVPLGTLQLSAEDPRTRETTWATARLDRPGAVNEVTLTLVARPRARLSGRVVGAHGQPVPLAWVAGYGESREYFGARMVPQDGTFLFESAPSGDVRLEVFDGTSREPALVQPLTLLPDGVHDVTLVLPDEAPRYGAVSGTVRRQAAGATTPVAGAPVWVGNGGLRTTTSQDGTYRIGEVRTGRTTVSALLPDSGRAVTTSTTVLEGATAAADLLFPDTSLGRVQGSVVDQAGRPRADALVEIWDEGPAQKLVAGARSGADGTFLLEPVPPGAWRVQATAVETRDGVPLRNAGSTTANLPAGGATATVTVGLRGFVEVSGRVVARVSRSDGTPVESPVLCTVQLHAGTFAGGVAGSPEAGDVFHDGPGLAGEVRTDPSTGAFRFSHVHGGPIRLVARSPFYGDRVVDLGEVRGDASRSAEIVFEGTLGVVDGDLFGPDGEPVAGARVTLHSSGDSFDGPLEATTDARGRFLFPLVPFGTSSRVAFSGPLSGVERHAEGHVRVSASAPRARVTLRVVPVGEVAVRVVREDAGSVGPVAGASVRVEETESPGRVFAGTTDADGGVRFAGVAAVPLAVRARKDLSGGRTAALGVGEGYRADALVTLAETATVTGTVKSPVDGAGLGGVRVVLDAGPRIGIRGATTTDADGRYILEDVPAGGTVYRVRAEDPATLRRGTSSAFTVAPGESRAVDVTLHAVGSVTGVLRTFDGSRLLPGAEVDVASHEDDGPGSSVVRVSTGEDGRYRADGIPAGGIVVRARDGRSGLSARATGRLSTEGEVLALDLFATPTGRLRGAVQTAAGLSLPANEPAPEVRLDGGSTHEVRLSAEYDFAEVDATTEFVLSAAERVAPYHEGELRGRVPAGKTLSANVRWAPFGTLRVKVVKPDPDHHGAFLPVTGVVRLGCGSPYAHRFPCNLPVRTDASGAVTLANVGVGEGGRLAAKEEATGAAGDADVEPFASDGETRDVTVVVAPRGVVRGRLLLPPDGTPAAGASVVLERRVVAGFWGGVASTVTGPDGRFELTDVPLASLAFRASATTGPVARTERTVSLSAAEPVAELHDLLLDAERPRLVAVTPSDGTTGVELRPLVEARFSEPLGVDLLARTPKSFVALSSPFGEVPVDVALEEGGTTLRLALPAGRSLAGATTYELRFLDTLCDRSGLTLGGDLVVRFTTADLTAPTVATSRPVAGEIQVPVDVNPFVVFTKALDPASVKTGVRLERLDAPAGPVATAPSAGADGKTVALNPSSPLEGEAEYEVVVEGVADAAGNRIPSPVRIPFLTRDDRAPVLVLEPPAAATPREGTGVTATVRFDADDVARVRVGIVAATGTSLCGEVKPESSERSVSFSCRLPRIADAGGPAVVLRASGSDRSGNGAAPVEVVLTLAPDTPPTLSVTSPVAGTRVLTGTSLTVLGTVTDDAGESTVAARLGTERRTTRGEGSFALVLPVPLVASAVTLPLEVSAVDGNGNPARPVVVPILVDPDVRPPTIAVSSPEEGQTVLGGRPVQLVVSASDDATGAALRFRVQGQAWSAWGPAALSVGVPTPAVASETTYLLELEARDGAGNLGAASVGIRLVPNLPPRVVVSAPTPGARVTAQAAFVVAGTVSDDGGRPVVTATYGGVTRTAAASSFSFGFTAPAVSTPTETTVTVAATDAEGNAAAPVVVPVTVVPDAGGTPTIVLTPPAPAVLLAGSGAVLSLTFADNVGLEEGAAEVTGGFSSGGRRSWALSGTSADVAVPLTLEPEPFGTPARLSATLRNVSARTTSLAVAIPVAFHRLERRLAPGPFVDGSALSATFRVSPEGRARAVALRLEVGTRSASGFVPLACVERRAPLSELETLTLAVPAGRTDLVLRSLLVEADGGEAQAADADGRSLFERPLATTADTVPPFLEVVSPAPSGTFASGVPVPVVVNAADDVGLRSIEVTFAGVTKACLASPCRVSFFAPRVAANASETLTAVAKDRSGGSASASVTVTVTPPGSAAPRSTLAGDGRKPRVTIVSPPLPLAAVAPGSTCVPFVDAVDADGIRSIEVFLGDDAKRPCLVLRPPEDGWPPRHGCDVPDLPDGTVLALLARATDGAGESAEARTSLVVRRGLTVRGPTTLTGRNRALAGRRLYVEGDVLLDGELEVGELHLRAGASLRPSAGGGAPDAVQIRAEGDVVVDAGATVDASGTGTRRASELDPEAPGDAEGEGAPHGGDAGGEPSARKAYGSFAEPVLPGARGGLAGTFGGGAVRVDAKRIGLAGAVLADGEDGNAERPSWRGLGAGGSIFLVARERFAAPAGADGRPWGVLSARGGTPSDAEAVPPAAAFAAGGRISLRAPALERPLLDVSGTDAGESVARGRPGTVFLLDAGTPDGVLLSPAPQLARPDPAKERP